jgi:anti-sigma-K factor RskA
MTLRCEEISEIIGPFALDALEPEERLLVLEHLSECREHDAELAEYREVTSLLPLAINDAAPPARLRSSILSEFDRLQGPAPVETVATPREAPAPSEPRAGLLDFFRRPVFAYGLAAALVLAIAGLTAWNLSLQDEDQPFVARTTQQGSNSLRMVYLPEEQVAILNLQLPPLTSDRAYQAWQITGAGPVSLGLVSGRGPTAIRADLSNASAIAITVEPAGGSAAPTTTPMLVTEI